MSSPWAGGERLWLWRAVAAVAAGDLLAVVLELLGPSAVLPHPGAPAWLLGLAASPWAVVTLGALGLLGAIWAMRRDAAAVATATWLVAMAVLTEAAAARGAGPYRGWFFVGAVGLGALLGRLWARLERRADLREPAAELGAVALLAACYVGAATSKLTGAGLGWADATTLRAVALAHAHVDAPGLAGALANSGQLARWLSLATVAIQLAAVGLCGPARVRTIAAVLLVGFHVGVAAFTRIGYWSPVVLLLAFGLPWPQWIARLRTPTPEPPLQAGHRGDVGVGALSAIVVVLAWALPIDRYTAGHHRPRQLDDDGEVAARTPVDGFGPLRVGEALVDGWSIDAIEREPSRAMIVLIHAEHGRAVLWITPRDAAGPASPFDRAGVRVAYEGDGGDRRFFAAAAVLADRLQAAAADAPRWWAP